MSQAISTEIRISDESLASLKSYADLDILFRDSGIVVESIEDYGNGFRVLKDKNRLVGVPFAIIEWRFNDGDYSDAEGNKEKYVAAYCMTESGEKHVLVDGGTGICRQLLTVTALREKNNHNNPRHGLMVPLGLTRSDYEYVDEKGKKSPASTFYLSE